MSALRQHAAVSMRHTLTEPDLPCAACGEHVPAYALKCPECSEDPGASEITCDECNGSGRVLSGISAHGQRLPAWEDREVPCSNCRGERSLNALYFADRERAARALFTSSQRAAELAEAVA